MLFFLTMSLNGTESQQSPQSHPIPAREGQCVRQRSNVWLRNLQIDFKQSSHLFKLPLLKIDSAITLDALRSSDSRLANRGNASPFMEVSESVHPSKPRSALGLIFKQTGNESNCRKYLRQICHWGIFSPAAQPIQERSMSNYLQSSCRPSAHWYRPAKHSITIDPGAGGCCC